MIGQEELKELLAYDAGKASVVSLYLDADTTQQTIETIKLQARTLLREANGLDKDTSTIEHYLDYSFDWSKPGLALFSCAEQDFFRDYPVAVSFRNRIRISPKPHVKPITHLIDHYAHYGVIIVDRIGARFFEYHLGELQDSAGTMGDDVRKQKHGGGSARGGGTSSATGQRGGQGGRHEEAVVQRNLRETAAAAEHYFSNKPIRRLFLGGTAENVAQFRELLSKKLQSRLAGTFPIDMTAGEHEVRQRSLELLEEANTKRERLLVQNMITTAAKGGNAVTGLDNTLRTVNEGRVQTLVVSDGYQTKGYISKDLQILASGRIKMEALGEEDLIVVEDIIEEAVTRTMGQGGSIEIVSDNSDLEEVGWIGALLRY